VPGEILRLDPAEPDHREIQVIFQQPLDRPGLRSLVRIQARVQLHRVFPFDVGVDEGGVADHHAIVVDERHFAVRRPRRNC